MQNKRSPILAIAGVALFLTTAANAQTPVRVRGTIERVDGPTYVVKARDGTELKVTLADNAQVTALTKASLGDIKQGSFVGITAMPQTDGSQRAVEVHIFPEAMRGAGEGHRPWDLSPNSTMTNANVEQAVTGVDGQTLTLKYKDGEKKIVVPSEAAIVTFALWRQERPQARRENLHCGRHEAARWSAGHAAHHFRQRRHHAADVGRRTSDQTRRNRRACPGDSSFKGTAQMLAPKPLRMRVR